MRPWIAALVVLIALGAGGVARGALLTDFANSYAQYQAQNDSAADFDRDQDIDGLDFLAWQQGMGRTNESNNGHGDANADHVVSVPDFNMWKTQFTNVPTGIPESVYFKLYFDPAGVVDGQVTVVVDVPQTGSNRFAVGTGNGLIAKDFRFDFSVVDSVKIVSGHERYEAQVHFTLKSTANPPDGPVTLFGYQVQDKLPTQSVSQAVNAFQFVGSDFITIRNADLSTTTFNESQLQDVTMTLQAPLVLDVSAASGQVSIRNPTGAAISMTYYEITSIAGSLSPTGWVSLDDGEGGDPPGVGWDEASVVNSHALSESNLLGSLTLNPGQTRALGAAFNPNASAHDLKFNYNTVGGGLTYGVVNFNPGSSLSPVPEPATSGLGLIGLSCLAIRRRQATRRAILAPGH
jgi:hypothetical protein